VLMVVSISIGERIGRTTMSVFIRILGLFIMALGIQMILSGIEAFYIH